MIYLAVVANYSKRLDYFSSAFAFTFAYSLPFSLSLRLSLSLFLCHFGKETYVCGLENRHMEYEVENNSPKESRPLYWIITLVSAVACALLIAFSPEWFWLTLPFLLTYFVKAIGMM